MFLLFAIDEALPYYERALDIRKKILGDSHPDTAKSLNNLGYLLQAKRNYAEAQRHFQQAVNIFERVFGLDHPDTANGLNNLAYTLHQQGHLGAARPLYERALAIREKMLGPDHLDTANSLHNVAVLYYDQGQLQEALEYIQRALRIREQFLDDGHPDIRNSRESLQIIEERLRQILRTDLVVRQLYGTIAKARSEVNRVLAMGTHDEREELHWRLIELVEWLEEGPPEAFELEVAAQLRQLIEDLGTGENDKELEDSNPTTST